MQQHKKSRTVPLLVSVASIILAYVFASLAIDTGRLLHYFLTFVALGLGIKYLVKFLKSYGSK